ncbi:RNA polymerase II C-terminal domain phosphatase-like 1 [Chenopodium quinoa]|uniref:RNA polymerase II C-terminal domain phosphatase-like 1 n=1 Tax=Chenopodium quinoa TaxID=63459 RepID=UPI000B791FBB|nr:RNA polymerase II C-terminal domain phosphatase-like 1 [Chenopodium quinoa]
MIKTVVYQGDNLLGEVEIYFENNNNNIELLMKGLRISDYSQASERCPPLAVLHTITKSSGGVSFKMMEKLHYFQQHQQQDSQIFALHSTCLRGNKTAVVPFGDQEIHLVAMRTRRTDGVIAACFWGFCVMPGLYESCLGMLNLRCLGIVFDLDETLIVANTLRSFEDRIEALQRKMSVEVDPQRLAGMMAEVKRYQEDKAILKQYAETDQVVDNGKVHKIQAEVIPALSDNHQTVVRPLIRLQDKNIVLTRINPQIRDTSVLVRLRPAWEDLRSYLTARGRKRFEVYVCTMAERDYALEMWRLLDPESSLIGGRELLDRIVCVKSGLKKSLFNVFHGGICHPKMALVIDDRLKVWDEKDQPRVHVVPAFAPYYAPQAEASNAIPVLCVARNVACNVRGGFFKDFDEGLLQRLSEVSFEDDPKDLPSPPDVSNYMVSEDDGSGSNGNKETICFDGMADAEVERRLKEAVLSSSALSLPSATSSVNVNLDHRLASSIPFTVAPASMTIPQSAPQASIAPYGNLYSQAGPLARPLGNIGPKDLGLHNSPAREEGEVPESELDPDTRRRLLILQHGQDMRPNESPFPVRTPAQAPVAAPGSVPATVPVPGSVPVAGPSPAPVSVSVPGPVSMSGPVPGPVQRVQSRGSWFQVEDHMHMSPLGRPPAKEFSIPPDAVHVEKQWPPPPSFPRKGGSPVWPDRSFPEKQRLPREAPRRDDRLRSNFSVPSHQSFRGDEISLSRSASSNKDFEVESEKNSTLAESPSAALHDIAMRLGTKVEFKPGLVATPELKFSMEAYFVGEKIGEGTGITRREAQQRCAEAALMNLADRYLTHKSDAGTPQSDTSRGQSPSGMGFVSDANSRKEETVPSSELTGLDDSIVDGSKDPMGSVPALKQLCMREGLDVDFKGQSPTSTNQVNRDEIHMEVEVNGQVLGKGTGSSLDEAKIQAAEMALATLKSMLGQNTKRPSSPRLLQAMTSKRLKPDYSRVLEHMASSRYPRNASPVP